MQTTVLQLLGFVGAVCAVAIVFIIILTKYVFKQEMGNEKTLCFNPLTFTYFKLSFLPCLIFIHTMTIAFMLHEKLVYNLKRALIKILLLIMLLDALL